MENTIKNQSGFRRVLYNEKAMGAYYTDHENARRIANLFEFPDEEVCCLEPSIGDGSAVSIVTGKDKGNSKVKIFGVELNRERYEDAKRNPNVDYLICADFMQDVKITNGKFSLCFMNPPYGKSVIGGERYERIFLKKVYNYLKTGAVLCMVVPYYIFLEDESFATILTNRFDVATILKFAEPEFSRFKQVVVVAIKKEKIVANPAAASEVVKYLANIDDAYVLPSESPARKLKIPASFESEITQFEGKSLDIDIAKSIPSMSKIISHVKEKTLIEDSVAKLGNPPLAPNRDHAFLLVVTGYSEGRMGNAADKTLHLQRGRVVTGTKRTVEEKTDGKVIEHVRYFKKTEVVIVENDGNITVLQ